MKLEFSSAEELTDFLYVMQAFFVPVAPEATPGVSLTFPVLDAQRPLQPTAALVAGGEVAFDTPPTGDTKGADSAPVAAEPQKRKRRTKAEIEADEQRIAADAHARKIADENREAHGAEVAAAVAQPQGANPFAQPEVVDNTVSTPEVVAGGEGDPAETVVTPFQHLTRAREFIAKHGMPKYNETFAKAGLDPNVMGYTAYQRGVHMATMDELDKA